MSSSASELESHLGYWLRFVSNHVSHAFRQKVEAEGVTVAEWVVLRALFDVESAHPSQIAQTIGMTRGAISKLVDRLSRKKLVQGHTDAADRRFQAIALSAAGRKLVPRLAMLADQNDQEFFGHLSEQDREHLTAVLRTIVQQRGLTSVPVE